MALFGAPRAFAGLDIGTASLKVVELIDRHRRTELATYGQASVPNLLLDLKRPAADAVRQMASVVARLVEQANVTTDAFVAALPASAVFSTVLTLPNIALDDMDRAVRFAAREVVPADLDEMVLGWSRVGEAPHMHDEAHTARAHPLTRSAPGDATPSPTPSPEAPPAIPVFVTAAPKAVVERYTQLLDTLQVDLVALEVETFPLARALLDGPYDSGIIVDIGDQVTAVHLIDRGTPRVSHTVDQGGTNMTQATAHALRLSAAEANRYKEEQGLTGSQPDAQVAIRAVVEALAQEARKVNDVYRRSTGRALAKSILIGGGAKLKGMTEVWSEIVQHKVIVGQPWRGLSYMPELEGRLQELGPTYAVAVGLAQRGFTRVQ